VAAVIDKTICRCCIAANEIPHFWFFEVAVADATWQTFVLAWCFFTTGIRDVGNSE